MADSKDMVFNYFSKYVKGWSISNIPSISAEELKDIDGNDLFRKYTFVLTGTDGEQVLAHFTNESITDSSDRSKAQIRFISEYPKVAYRYAKLKKLRFFLFSIYSKPESIFSFFTNIKPSEYIISIETNLDECGVRPDITSLYEALNSKGSANFTRIPRGFHTAGVEQASFIRILNNGAADSGELENYISHFDNRPYMRSIKKGDNIVYVPSKIFEKGRSNEQDYPRNLLVFGAPGTGKSDLISKKISRLEEENGKENIEYERVTFFEDYSYNQFVGSYKPIPVKNMEQKIIIDNGSNKIEGSIVGEHVSYQFVPGPFAQVLSKAIISKLKGDNKKFILIIEELNRANAASVFGDIFQLLDRENGISQYDINIPKPFAEFLYNEIIKNADEKLHDISKINIDTFSSIRLPENMYIWATMNSADQGVFSIDTAFKRRWSFLYKDIDDVSPDSANRTFISLPKYDANRDTIDVELYDWNSLRREINRSIIEAGFEEDRCIGYWFFKAEEMDSIATYSEYSVKAYRGEEDANIKLQQLPNPLLDKLISYLKQDVFRNNPTGIFRNEFKSLSTIRFALRHFEINDRKNITLRDILKLNESKAFVPIRLNKQESLEDGGQNEGSNSAADTGVNTSK